MQSYIIQKTKSAGTLKTKAEKQIPKNGERHEKSWTKYNISDKMFMWAIQPMQVASPIDIIK